MTTSVSPACPSSIRATGSRGRPALTRVGPGAWSGRSQWLRERGTNRPRFPRAGGRRCRAAPAPSSFFCSAPLVAMSQNPSESGPPRNVGWAALWLVLGGVAVVLVLLGLVLEGDLLVLALLDVDLLLVVALELGVVGLLDDLHLDPALVDLGLVAVVVALELEPVPVAVAVTAVTDLVLAPEPVLAVVLALVVAVAVVLLDLLADL